MKKIIVGSVAALLLLAGCSSMEGQFGKKVETFTDDHGRVCTTVKWADAAGVDCDFKP